MMPFTYNLVGAYFQAGNVGFMRDQLRYEHRREAMAFSVGLASSGLSTGLTTDDGPFERGVAPLLELRLVWMPDQGRHQIGLAGLGGWHGYTQDQRLTRELVFAANLYAELRPADMLTLRAEATYGRNLADLGMLGLSSQTAANGRLDEAAGFVSFRLTHASLALFGGAGASYILHPGKLPGLTEAKARTALAGAIAHNITAKLGLSVDLGLGLTAFAEYAYFHTQYALGAGTYRNIDANVPEVGVQWIFG